MYKCQECGRKFKTVKAAERAINNGCPNCNGVDIDIDVDPKLAPKPPRSGKPGPKSLSDLFRF